MLNCNTMEFKFILDGVNTGQAPAEYLELVSKMTTYKRNTQTTLNNAGLIGSSEKKCTAGLVGIGAVRCICEDCGDEFPSAINAVTGLEFEVCRRCGRNRRQHPARAKSTAQTYGGPQMKNKSRAELQKVQNKRDEAEAKSAKEKSQSQTPIKGKKVYRQAANSDGTSSSSSRKTTEVQKELNRVNKALVNSYTSEEDSEQDEE